MTVDELRKALAWVPGDFQVLGEAGCVGFDQAQVDWERREVIME